MKAHLGLALGAFVLLGGFAASRVDAHATCTTAHCCSPHGLSFSIQSNCQFSSCSATFTSGQIWKYTRHVQAVGNSQCSIALGCGAYGVTGTSVGKCDGVDATCIHEPPNDNGVICNL
jgi:hypothetical protein